MSKWTDVNYLKPPDKHEVIIRLENGAVTTGWTIEGVWYYGGEPAKVIAWQELPDKTASKTISERITAIESNFSLPGTQLVRALHNHEVVWCLSIGELQGPQWFFYGHTIEDCLTQAEEQICQQSL